MLTSLLTMPRSQEGNYDLVANNLPVFFVRDTFKFPDVVGFWLWRFAMDDIYVYIYIARIMEATTDVAISTQIHSQRRHPLTLMKDWDAYWDFLSLTPECAHMMTAS